MHHMYYNYVCVVFMRPHSDHVIILQARCYSATPSMATPARPPDVSEVETYVPGIKDITVLFVRIHFSCTD